MIRWRAASPAALSGSTSIASLRSVRSRSFSSASVASGVSLACPAEASAKRPIVDCNSLGKTGATSVSSATVAALSHRMKRRRMGIEPRSLPSCLRASRSSSDDSSPSLGSAATRSSSRSTPASCSSMVGLTGSAPSPAVVAAPLRMVGTAHRCDLRRTTAGRLSASPRSYMRRRCSTTPRRGGRPRCR